MNMHPELLRSIASELSTLSVLIKNLAMDPKPDMPQVEIKDKPVEPEKPSITLPEIRAKLAEYSQAGFTSEIRKILGKFNASKLSEIKPEDYPAVLMEAEKLNE